MKKLPRIVTTWLTLALAMPVLGGAVGCDECEERCHYDYDDCESGDDEQREQCDAELNQCLGICASQPRDPQY